MNRKQKQQKHNTIFYIQKKKSQKLHKEYWYHGKWR